MADLVTVVVLIGVYDQPELGEQDKSGQDDG